MTFAAAWAVVRAVPWAKLAPVVVLAAALILLGVVRHQRDSARTSAAAARAEARTDAASLATLERARAADDAAAAQHAADQSRRAAEAAALKESTDALPSRPLSDRQRARLGCLRDERAARAAGRPVPACGRTGASAGAG